MESILGLICYVAIGGADIFQISVIPAVVEPAPVVVGRSGFSSPRNKIDSQ